MVKINVHLLSSPRSRTLLTQFLQVTLKKDADAAQLDQAKKQVTDQGGKIVNEYTLIKAFTYACSSLYKSELKLT